MKITAADSAGKTAELSKLLRDVEIGADAVLTSLFCRCNSTRRLNRKRRRA